MNKKNNYESPFMEVVELKLQGCLLAGSSMNGTGTFDETGTLNGFDDFE